MSQDSPRSNSGIGRALRILAILGAALFVFALVVFFAVPILRVVAFLGLFLGGIFLLVASIMVIIAKRRALNGEPAPFWLGLGSIVAWNPTEGVLFLKNKNIHSADSNAHDGGGIRVIFPVLGEELILRVPLEIQTLSFSDTEILTKEYIPLSIQGTIYWKVIDLNKFYLLVSKNVQTATTGPRPPEIKTASSRTKFEVAEYWLRSMAEEKTRSVVSQLGTGLLIADKLASDLPSVFQGQGENLLGQGAAQSPSTRSTTEGLANVIKNEFTSTINEYGLEIHRIALQELKLPPEIYAAAVEACKSAYLPIKAKAEAIERQLKLQAESDVVGKDAVGLKEIAGNVPALAVQEFLSPLFLSFNKKRMAGMAVAPPPVPPASAR